MNDEIDKYVYPKLKAFMAEHVHSIGNWIAASITVASLVKLLPALAALTSIIWWGLCIVEKLTGKTIHQLITRDKATS